MASLSFGLSGCLGSLGDKVGMSPATPPPWVISPPPDTPSTYFGLGQGHDLPSARRSALRDIAAKLKVSVTGTLESKTTVRNDAVSQSAMSRVTEEVQKTEFKNFKVLQTHAAKDGVYALVSVDRQEFVQNTKDKIDRLLTGIDTATKSLETKPAIEQFMQLRRQRPSIAMARGYFDVLDNKDLSAEDKARMAHLDQLATQSAQVAESLVFRIQSSPQDKDVEAAVSGFLSANNVRTDTGGASAAATVKTAVTPRLDSIPPSKIVRLTVTLTIGDNKGRSVASRQYVVSGTSLTDHLSARQQAVFALQKELQEVDLVSGLGFTFE